MRHKAILPSAVSLLIVLALVAGLGWGDEERDASRKPLSESDRQIARHAQGMLEEGRRIFRFDTFGSEAFFGDALQLHKAIAGAKNGGVGAGGSPKTALAVGLQGDADALPDELKAQLRAGKGDLHNPATTLALLQLRSAVRVPRLFDETGRIPSMG